MVLFTGVLYMYIYNVHVYIYIYIYMYIRVGWEDQSNRITESISILSLQSPFNGLLRSMTYSELKMCHMSGLYMQMSGN